MIRSRSALLLGAILSALCIEDARGQEPARPRVWVDGGVERTSNDAETIDGITVGLRVRLPVRRLNLAVDYVHFPSQHQEGPFLIPPDEPATVAMDGSDHLLAIGLQGTLLRWSRRRLALSVRPGAGVAFRDVRSTTAIYDSTGAFDHGYDYSSHLFGLRGEVALDADLRVGPFVLGLSAGPTVMFGTGSGANGEVAFSALRTWFLRGRIGF